MKYPTLQQSANIAAIVLVFSLVVFGGMKITKSYLHNRDAVKTLTEQVASKDAEIGSLRENLSKTEEGKKAVEAAKALSDANASAQSKRASSAEADAAIKGSQLSTAQNNLANVQRCVTKFQSILPSITRYNASQVEENRLVNVAKDYYFTDYNTYLYYYGLAAAQTSIANSLWPTIQSAMNSISSGVCY